jgi:hypothetical protein
MGTVYLAYDRERHGRVALKTLRELDGAALYRFKQEFRALADVSHPNLVQLYELLSADGEWFFTMEYVDGRHFLDYVWEAERSPGGRAFGLESSLHTQTSPGVRNIDTGAATSATIGIDARSDQTPVPALHAGPLTARRFERLRPCLRQLAEGVQALHETGHLHRDIKPSNILVTDTGRVVLLDFGIIADLSAPLSDERGAAIGTPAYMAPEQARGETPCPGSDWYAVGVALYEALTGTRPFAGTASELLRARQLAEPPPPRRHAADVPADLDALCSELLRRDPEARPLGPAIVARLGGDPAELHELHAHALAGDALIGRDDERARLQAAFSRARTGDGGAVFLSGDSGLGKSALARGFLDEVVKTRRAVVLAGRCHERESVPYKAIDSLIDALSRFLVGLDAVDVDRLLPRDTRALVRVFPVLRRVGALLEAGPRAITADPQELRRRGFSALRELLGRLAERYPVVLFVDDLQWTDEDSAQFLVDLLRPPEPPPLLFLGSYRRSDGADHAALDLLLREMRSDAEQLTIAPLSELATQALARELLPGERAELAELVARESAGDPYFVRALARHLATGAAGARAGALSLEEILRGHIAELSEPARRTLEILVAAGRPTSRKVAIGAARVEAHATAVIDELRRARLLRGRGAHDDDRVEVYHSRIARVVEAELTSERARGRHLALARELEAERAPDHEAIAFHYHAASEPTLAAAHAIAAADRALEALAFDRAARLYGLALELCGDDNPDQRCALLVRRGDALANAGRSAAAAACYAPAVALAPPSEALELERRVADQYLRAGHVGEGMQALHRVVRATGMRMPPRRGVLLYLAWLRVRVALRGKRYRLRPRAEIADGTARRLLVSRTGTVGLAMVDVLRGAAFQARTYLLALDVGEPSTLARTLCAEAGFLSFPGPSTLPRVARLLERARDIGDAYDDSEVTPWADGCQALAEYLSGRFRRALALAETAERGFKEQYAGSSWERTTAHLITVWSLYYLGRYTELASRVTALIRDAEERGDQFAVSIFSVGNPSFHWLAADTPQAADAARERAMQGWPSSHGYHTQHWWDLCGRARRALYAGDGAAAWALFQREWPRVRRAQLHRSSMVRLEASELCAAAALCEARRIGDDARAAATWLRRAEREARRIGGVDLEIAGAIAQRVLAGVLAGRGALREAARAMDRAARGFDACDATGFAAACRLQRAHLLRACGAEPRADELGATARAQLLDCGAADVSRMANLLAGLGARLPDDSDGAPATAQPESRGLMEPAATDRGARPHPAPQTSLR